MILEVTDVDRTGIQLTGEVDFEKTIAEVDREKAQALMKEYVETGK